MSEYPVWWDKTLTVYNRYQDPQTSVVRWYKHTVDNCFWRDISEKINVGNTLLETKNIVCRIPEQDNFLEKYQWVDVPNDEMDQYLTLGVGDIIVRGKVSDEINEYTNGSRSSDLLAKYKELQGCLTVQETNLAVGPGRNNPHYYVRGF